MESAMRKLWIGLINDLVLERPASLSKRREEEFEETGICTYC